MSVRHAATMHAMPCIAHCAVHQFAPLPSPTARSSNRQSRAKTIPTRIYASASSESEGLAPTSGASSTALAPDREGYRSFVMQGCEFLVRQTPDGALALAETFIVDTATGASERPTTIGSIPSEPMFFQPAEMATDYPGNVFEDKEEKRTVLKIYFAVIESLNPYKLGIERFYLMDSAKRSVEKLAVQRLAPPDTPEHELRVRIRDRWIVIDTASSVPTAEAVVQAALQGGTAMSRLEKEARDRGEAGAGDSGDEGEAGEQGGEIEGSAEYEDSDVLYDNDLLKDFLVEVDDENENDFDEYDMPATDY